MTAGILRVRDSRCYCRKEDGDQLENHLVKSRTGVMCFFVPTVRGMRWWSVQL